MTRVCWLGPDDGPERLPPPTHALSEPNGLLAAGGSLTPDWLLASYERGIFPWYEQGQPILWWSPDPRAVLWPRDLNVSRSLNRTLRRAPFRLSADRSFDDVVRACAAPRDYTDATWITTEMALAYGALHGLGWAHSFEAWEDDILVGGLYGVAIGRVFFGESMFARRTDASKIAFVNAVRFLLDAGFELIDCQIPSAHLTRLGATPLPREEFLQQLKTYCRPHEVPQSWHGKFEAFQRAAQ
jgi:leucyl/phenylalanyl-tRNA--protein transferase